MPSLHPRLDKCSYSIPCAFGRLVSRFGGGMDTPGLVWDERSRVPRSPHPLPRVLRVQVVITWMVSFREAFPSSQLPWLQRGCGRRPEVLLHSHPITGAVQREQLPFLTLASSPLNPCEAEPGPRPGLGMGISQAQVSGHPPPQHPLVCDGLSAPHLTPKPPVQLHPLAFRPFLSGAWVSHCLMG